MNTCSFNPFNFRVHIGNIFLSLIFLSFFVDGLNAQISDKQYLDSMELEIDKVKDPYKKARKILLLSNHWSYRDTIQAFETIKRAEKYYNGNKSLEGLGLIYKAGIIYDTDIERSQKIYMQADEILKDLNDPLVYDDRAILWHNYAALEQIKGDDKTFVKIIIEKCIPLVKKSKNENLLASYYTDVGMTLNNIQEYAKSEEYFKLALEILHKLPEDKYDVKIWTLVSLANMYTQSNQLNKAKQILDQVGVAFDRHPASQYSTLYQLFLAQYYTKTNEIDKAYEAIDKGIYQAEKLSIPYDVESLKFEKYKLLKKDEKFDKAADVIIEILKSNVFDNPKNRMSYLQEMAWVQSKLGKYRNAYEYQILYQQVKDSLHRLDIQKNIRELEAKYDTTLKEQRLERLENKSRQQRTLFIASVIVSVGFISFLIYAFFQRKKRNKTQMQILQKSKDLEVAKAIIQGGIAERKRIANDLHDGISGRITGIKIALENIHETNIQTTTNNEVLQLGEVLTELRGIVRNLVPETLLRSVLTTVLEDFCHSMESGQTSVELYTCQLEKIKDETQQLNIYRIVQELVTNSIRHGKAREILVQVVYENSVLLIDIEDDGVGFNPQTVQRNLGLNSVENRVKFLNGTVKWRSEPGQGTIVNIDCKL